MPSPTRPSIIPAWTVGNTGSRTQPTDGQQLTGFVPSFRPPSSWHNWLFGIFSDWINWIQWFVQAPNFEVSNVGHNIATSLNLQGQLDQFDAYLSGLGIKKEFAIAQTAPGSGIYPLAHVISSKDNVTLFIGNGLAEIDESEYDLITYGGGKAIQFHVGHLPDDTDTVSALEFVGGIVFGGGGGGGSNGALIPYGSVSTPLIVSPAAGIDVSTDQRQIRFISSTGGAQYISANPQVAPGTIVGQELVLTGGSDTNYLILQDGTGLSINGALNLTTQIAITFVWTGIVWKEISRR